MDVLQLTQTLDTENYNQHAESFTDYRCTAADATICVLLIPTAMVY